MSKICSELRGEVFISIVHYDGDINVPDHMPPLAPGKEPPGPLFSCPVRCRNSPPSAPCCQSRGGGGIISLRNVRPVWLIVSPYEWLALAIE